MENTEPLTEEQPFAELSPSPLSGEGKEDVLIAANLKKTFRLSAKQRKIEKTPLREKIAVNGISFKAKRGEIYGLLGPNGAGKTTTLRMLATLIRPDEGDALINGYSIVKQPDKVRSQIGFLTSELKLDDFFTPNYIFDFFSELQNIPTQVRDERKRTLFGRFGIDKFAETKIADLSTGMKQKTSIAVSLVHDPEFIIFDEPTAGLDPEERLRFKNIVSKLEGERTIIISTHIVEDVENLCDELVIINNGTVAAQGTCAEIENAAAGKVYEIEDSRLGELSEPYFIQRQFERDSKRMTAVLSAQAQPTAASVSPRVEDGYICITKNI